MLLLPMVCVHASELFLCLELLEWLFCFGIAPGICLTDIAARRERQLFDSCCAILYLHASTSDGKRIIHTHSIIVECTREEYSYDNCTLRHVPSSRSKYVSYIISYNAFRKGKRDCQKRRIRKHLYLVKRAQRAAIYHRYRTTPSSPRIIHYRAALLHSATEKQIPLSPDISAQRMH